MLLLDFSGSWVGRHLGSETQCVMQLFCWALSGAVGPEQLGCSRE